MNKRECTKHIALRLITELERFPHTKTVDERDRERYRQAELDYALELRRRHCINTNGEMK